MAILTPILSTTPGVYTYNPDIADTFSWVPVNGVGVNRPLYARAVYVTNPEDITLSVDSLSANVNLGDVDYALGVVGDNVVTLGQLITSANVSNTNNINTLSGYVLTNNAIVLGIASNMLADYIATSATNASVYSSVYNTSGNWNRAYNFITGVSSISGNWSAAYSNLVANSAAYLSAVDLSFLSVSGNWNGAYASTAALSLSTSSWNNAYTSVTQTSSNWNTAYASTTALNLNSDNWSKAYNISTAYQNASGSFATNTNLNSVSGSLLTTINSASGSLNTTINNASGSLYTLVSNISGSLETTINNVSSSLYTTITSTSGSLYTLVGNTSALLVPTTTLQSISSSLYTTINNVSGNLNTTIKSTSSLLLPTSIYQNASGSFATNTNLNSVSGSLLTTINSASGSLNTTINSTSALLLPITTYQNTSGNYVNYTDINSVSGNWNSAYVSTTALNLSTSSWNNTYTAVSQTSSNWNNAVRTLSTIPYVLVNIASVQPVSGGSTVSGNYSVIAGGYDNCIEAGVTYSFIGGGGGTSVGSGNCAYDNQTVIGGGNKNEVHGIGSAILGGLANITNGSAVVVGGGVSNCACADGTFIGGGQTNSINVGATYSSIIGGNANIIKHSNSHIIGSGITTTASNYTYVNNLSTQGNIHGTFYGDGSNLIGASLPGQANVNTAVTAGSGNWNSAYASTTALNLSSGKWNNAYTSVAQTSTNWNSAYASTTALNLSTSSWNNAYTSVAQTSSNWNTAYSFVTGASSSFTTGTLTVSSTFPTVSDNQTLLVITGNSNQSVYNQIQNTFTGVSASVDIVVTNDTNNAYFDLGINSSQYNGNNYIPNFTIAKANDSYAYSVSGNLTVGTATSGIGDLVFFTGGTLSGSKVLNGNEVMRITNTGGPYTGNIGIGTSTPNTNLTVVGNVSATGAIYGDGTYLTNIQSSNIVVPVTNSADISTYTLQSTDHGRTIFFNNNTALLNLNITNSFFNGFTCEIVQNGSQPILVTPGSGITVNSYGGALKSAGQFAAFRVIQVAANTYHVAGNLVS
jgi:hypothetical protein